VETGRDNGREIECTGIESAEWAVQEEGSGGGASVVSRSGLKVVVGRE
jgi:hypothetical protein